MRNPYAALLRVPGAAGFSSAAFVARLPISMVGIGVVLLVAASGGRYGLAGAVSAVLALAGAVGQPLTARVVDRHGQLRVVAVTAAVSQLAMVGLVVLAVRGAPAWALLAAAAVAGATFPNVGSLVRARWSARLSGMPLLRTAFSLESVLDELIFVLGPPFVTLMAARIGSPQALLTVVAVQAVGLVLLLAQRRSEPPPTGRPTRGGPRVLSRPGLVEVVALLTALGAVFGSVEVVTVAFADERDRPLVAGVVLALYAAGSLIAGLVYGALHPAAPLGRQLAVLGRLVPLTVVALPVASSAVVLGGLMLLAGFVVAPTLIASFALVESTVPTEQLTEGLTWATTGITLGVSLGAVAAGWAIDAVGTPHAFVVTTVAGVLTALVTVAARGRLIASATG